MSGPRRQRGIALLSVIFVMLVLAMMAAYLAEAISGRHVAATLDALQRQADHAAQAGVEWARDRALVAGACANTQLAYGDLTVDVTCATQQVNENGTLYAIFDVTATAWRGTYGDTEFVRRTRRARLAAR